MKAPRLTKTQARAVRSLIEDSGYSKADARALVLEGFGPDTDQRYGRGFGRYSDADSELARGEDNARAREEREGDENAECAWESPE